MVLIYVGIDTCLTYLVCSPFVWQPAQAHYIDQLSQTQTGQLERESSTWFFEDLYLSGPAIWPSRHTTRNGERRCDPVLWPKKVINLQKHFTFNYKDSTLRVEFDGLNYIWKIFVLSQPLSTLALLASVTSR